MNKLKPIETERVEVEILMSKEKATMLTEDIKSTTSALYVLLKQAHDERAWVALGYKTWAEYVETEFEFSRARSYQLINQANVIEEINEAGGIPLYITEREARAIKKRLPEITEKIKNEVSEDDSDAEVEAKVREILEEENESEEIDNASKHGKAHGNEDDEGEEKFHSPTDEDGGYKNPSLSEDDKFFYNNLLITLKIFKELPEANKFGRLIKNSSEDKKELSKLLEGAFSWITQILDELE